MPAIPLLPYATPSFVTVRERMQTDPVSDNADDGSMLVTLETSTTASWYTVEGSRSGYTVVITTRDMAMKANTDCVFTSRWNVTDILCYIAHWWCEEAPLFCPSAVALCKNCRYQKSVELLICKSPSDIMAVTRDFNVHSLQSWRLYLIYANTGHRWTCTSNYLLRWYKTVSRQRVATAFIQPGIVHDLCLCVW